MPVPEAKVQTQSLCDLICGVMPLYESFYSKVSTSVKPGEYARQLENHTASLKEWRRRSPVVWPGKITSTGLHAVDQALSICYYSSYMSLLCLMRLQIRRRLRLSGEQAAFGDHAEIVGLVTELKEVVAFLLREKCGFHTRPHIPFAVHACWTVLEETGQLDGQWLDWFRWAEVNMQKGGIFPFTTPWKQESKCDGGELRKTTPQLSYAINWSPRSQDGIRMIPGD